MEKRELRSFEIRKRKYKRRILILSILLILLAITIAAIFIYRLMNRNYIAFQVVNTTERNDSNSARYLSYGSGVLRYSRDGAMAMDGAGTLLWNGTYEMNDPIVDVCDKYVSVSDRGYETVQIFNGEGGMATVNVHNPIIKTEIANQGVVAVLMDGTDMNLIELYSADGDFLAEIKTVTAQDGYPIDMTLSDDGRKMVTSYVSVNNGKIQNKVTFFNFGEVGQNFESRVVAYEDYKQTLVPNVQFINKDTVCVFGDNKFDIYNMKEIPELVSGVSLPSEVKSLFYSSSYIGFVLKNEKGEKQDRILVYDLLGNVKLDKAMDIENARSTLSEDELIMYNDTEWEIWRLNGRVKLRYTFESNISYVLPVNNLDLYVVVDDHSMNEVKLLEKKKNLE